MHAPGPGLRPRGARAPALRPPASARGTTVSHEPIGTERVSTGDGGGGGGYSATIDQYAGYGSSGIQQQQQQQQPAAYQGASPGPSVPPYDAYVPGPTTAQSQQQQGGWQPINLYAPEPQRTRAPAPAPAIVGPGRSGQTWALSCHDCMCELVPPPLGRRGELYMDYGAAVPYAYVLHYRSTLSRVGVGQRRWLER